MLAEDAELIVVGAGPAGSSCAAIAAERGIEVLLIDQDDFPREKPCGDGLKRSAVAFLGRLGLDQLVASAHSIEGARIVLDHGRSRSVSFPARPDRPRWGACIARSTLDHSLRDAALARGARFLQRRVTGPVRVDGRIGGVSVSVGGATATITEQVRGRIVVAADGATSRLRRECGLRTGGGATGYALRRYFHTERELDPLFEIHVPLVLDGAVLPGYGWVFPLGGRLANVGVGLLRGPGLERAPSLRLVLASFIEALRARSGARLGDIRAAAGLRGSPIPLGFGPERCELPGAFFAGDAAHAVDPLSGEGIAYAMQTGAAIAEAACSRLRHGAARRGQRLGVALAQEFPRLEQDPALVARLFVRAMSHRHSAADARPEPTSGSERDAALDALRPLTLTPSRGTERFVSPLEGIDPDARGILESWSRQLLELVRTPFPLAYELLQHELRECSGLTVAATALLAGAAVPAAAPGRVAQLRRVGLAGELMRLAHRLIGRIPGRERTRHDRLRSCFGVLAGDFCLTRWMELIVPAGGRVCRALIETNALMCEAQLVERARRFDLDRTPEQCLAAAGGEGDAVLFAAAARLGGEVVGASRTDADALERCGRELGVAQRIAEEIVELLKPDGVDVADARRELRRGVLGLPALYALQERSDLRRLIHPGMSDAECELAIGEIRVSGGPARARAECGRRVLAAQRALDPLGGEQLRRFASFATGWIAREAPALTA